MSIKRYREDFKKAVRNTDYYPGSDYINTLHPKMKKPKNYAMECGDDVHTITVMPNRTVHFHNHPNLSEMVHLITFDILQNPEISDSTLPTCLRVLRALRTRNPYPWVRYPRDGPGEYCENLVSNNTKPVEQRRILKTKHTPVPWREEVLKTYRNKIKNYLIENLKYYGMEEKGWYVFKMKFNFNLTQSFMPSASMSLHKGENYGRKDLILDIQVSPKWLINVWLKDRAVILQNLVLDIVKEYPNGTTLCMVAKQSHGFKIIPRLAVVDWKREAISWVIDNEKKEELLDTEKVPRMRRTKKELTMAGIQPILDVCNKEEALIKEKQNELLKDEDIPF